MPDIITIGGWSNEFCERIHVYKSENFTRAWHVRVQTRKTGKGRSMQSSCGVIRKICHWLDSPDRVLWIKFKIFPIFFFLIRTHFHEALFPDRAISALPFLNIFLPIYTLLFPELFIYCLQGPKVFETSGFTGRNVWFMELLIFTSCLKQFNQ